MSTWYRQALTCRRCGASFEAALASGLHVMRAPEDRERVVRGELHRVHCTHCNAASDVDRALVYTDLGRGEWIHVFTPADLGAWQTREQEALAMFDRTIAKGPPAVASLATRVRVVFDVDELREKLVIWDASLDDAIVECAKLACVRARPDLLGRRLRVRAAQPDGSLVMAAIDAKSPRVDLARWPMRATIERAVWQSEFPELFDRGFVSIDRYVGL